MPRRLDESAVAERLRGLSGWRREGESIRREYVFPDFPAAIRFVDRLAGLAEAMDHHPDIDIRYRRVVLALSTHSAGGLTDLDFELAARIDAGGT